MNLSKRISTIEDKNAALDERREAERALASQIDRALQIVEDDADVGCNFCFLLRRFRGRTTVGEIRTVSEPTAAKKAASTAFFGARKKKADPNAKLQEAAAAMQERIRALEYRAIDSKREASQLMKQGQKQAALRALKKSKALDKQVEQNQAALDAVEQQVDLMAQAEMQKQVTAALHTSSQGMKSSKEMLKKAESAIDDATDARDAADDLNGVMSEFAAAGSNDVDDDELLSELQRLVEAGDDPPPPTETGELAGGSTPSASELGASAQRAAVMRLEEQHRAWDEAERVRKSLPSACKKASEEKVRLIASAV